MTDLLGPADAGAPRTAATTTDVTNPNAADTWFVNCTSNTPGTGTPIVAKWTNRLLQQIRRVIRLSGIPLANADDDMLGQAIQSGSGNWAGTFGGSANALTATLSPVPTSLLAGTVIAGQVASNNNAVTTINANSLGAITMYRSDGVAFGGGELVIGGDIEGIYDGTNVQLLSQLPMSFIRSPTRFVYCTSTTTITVSGNETRARVQMWAPGGTGATTTGTTQGGGGGGGAYIDLYLTGLVAGNSLVCTISASVTVAIGVSTAATANAGGNGSGTSAGTGGTGSISIGTGITATGQAGANGSGSGATGYGGAASFSTGYSPPVVTTATAGNAGLFPGGGGSGGYGAAGGLGAAGLILVEMMT